LTLWGFNLGFFAQTTEAYLRADPTEKPEAMNAVVPPMLKRGRFRAPDKLIASLRDA